jgi:NitT/TauT family transport system permease protein
VDGRKTERSRSDLALGAVGVVVVLAAWQLCASLNVVDPTFTSSPSRIYTAYHQLISSGELWIDIRASSGIFLKSLGFAIITGIPIGMIMGWYWPVNGVLGPLVNLFNATPRLALLPVYLVWFGIGSLSKEALVYGSAVLPIIINAIAGIKDLDPTLVRAARSFGARDLALFRTVALPASVPFLVSGIRIAIAEALTATVVSEIYAATAGIGYLISVSGNTFATDNVFVGLTLVAVVGVILTAVLHRIERYFESWRPPRSLR